MRRRSRWIPTAVLAVVGAVAVAATAASTAQAAPTGIAPFLSCVVNDNLYGQNWLSVWFGYVSANSGTIDIPVGADNFVSPDPADRGQATTFSPGAQSSSWVTTFDLGQTPSLTWTLLGQSTTATDDPSNYCSVAPWPPGPQGPQGPQGPTGPAGPQGPQGTSGFAQIAGDPVSVAPRQQQTATASCPDGDAAIDGGYQLLGAGHRPTPTLQVFSSYPSGRSWVVTVANQDAGGTPSFRVHATCVNYN